MSRRRALALLCVPILAAGTLWAAPRVAAEPGVPVLQAAPSAETPPASVPEIPPKAPSPSEAEREAASVRRTEAPALSPEPAGEPSPLPKATNAAPASVPVPAPAPAEPADATTFVGPPSPEFQSLPELSEDFVGPPSPLSPEAQAGSLPGAALCQIPVPNRPEVKAELGQFTGRSRNVIARGLDRAGRYLPMIRSVFAEAGLPPELASLPLIESSYVVNALSRAGALGMWQFIASTARESQLRVDWWVDERLDPEASTRAAARHLSELYGQFGDWELVLAAYNAGSGGVGRAMSRSKQSDFWGLLSKKRLHPETQHYVPKFYAALEILLDPTEHGFAPIDENGALRYDTVKITSPVDLYTVSKYTGIPYSELRDLNPSLIRACTPPNAEEYPLKVPEGWGGRVAEALASLDPNERFEFKKHRVAQGETVKKIAQRYGVGVDAISEINKIASDRPLKRGSYIVVPVRRGGAKKTGAEAAPPTANGDGCTVHAVAQGDTLSDIARQYGVSVRDLLRWNSLKERSTLRIGQELRVSPPESPGKPKAADKPTTPPTPEAASKPEPAAKPPEPAAKPPEPAAKPPEPAEKSPESATRLEIADNAAGREEVSPPPETDAREVHIVAKGDTLWKIAQRRGVTVHELAKWNSIGEDAALDIGQQLRVTSPRDATGPGDGDATTYRVKQGDTLWSIAGRQGVTVEDLKKWNRLEGAVRLQIGDVLRVK
jgi:membrane-bound lytic murein transglycosylase D